MGSQNRRIDLRTEDWDRLVHFTNLCIAVDEREGFDLQLPPSTLARGSWCEDAITDKLVAKIELLELDAFGDLGAASPALEGSEAESRTKGMVASI